MSLTRLQPNSVNKTANFTFANVTANYFIGDGSQITGITVSGGTAITNGTSNVAVALNGNVTVGVSGTNDVLTITTNKVEVAGNVSATYFIGNGSQLTGISSGTTYANSNVADYLPTYTGNVSANYFIGNGSQLTGLPASYSNANVASYLPTYSGNVAGSYFIGNGSTLINITGANVTGYVPLSTAANTAGTVTTAAQPNITSVGTLTGLTATGIINVTNSSNVSLGAVGNVHITGGSSGYVLSTDGSGTLSWVVQSGGGSVTASQYATKYTRNTSQSLVAATDNTIVFNNSVFDPQSWFNTGSSKFQPTIAGYYKVSYTVWFITGTPGSGNQFNIQIRKNENSIAITQQPQGTNTGQSLVITDSVYLNGGSDYLTFTAYTTVAGLETLGGNGTWFEAFLIGSASATTSINNANSNINIASTNANITMSVNGTSNVVVVSNNHVTVAGNILSTNANLGNLVTANYFIGNGATLTNITGANVTGYVPNATNANTATNAGTVTTAAQPNITSVGTLTSLTVSGLITATGTGIKASNIQDSTGTIAITTKYNNQTGDVGVYGNIVAGTSGSGNITATYFIGNGSQLTGITATNATTAGTVTTGAQPNITSVGTLANLIVSGNATVGSGVGGSITGGNLLSANYVSGTLTTAAQPNITSVGTLSSLTVTGNINGNYILGNGATLTNITGANVTGYVPNANSATTTGTVTTAAQPNITSVGTLTSLIIGGQATFQQSIEVLTTKTGATGTVVHDFSTGAIFYHTGPSANFTANFTNVPTTDNRAVVITLVMVQGATAYLPTAVQIAGVAQTIKWSGGSAPTGTSSGINPVTFVLFRVGAAWTVTGVMGAYS